MQDVLNSSISMNFTQNFDHINDENNWYRAKQKKKFVYKLSPIPPPQKNKKLKLAMEQRVGIR